MANVQLLVYDLSRGMAPQMSEAFLGQRIEGIWHTGVLVFGLEFFYGGGIQKVPAGVFSASNGLLPVSQLDMGWTNRSQRDLEAFLRTIRPRFTAETYDLLSNNCNNFSDEVVRFLCGHGIPAHILDLPRIALNSPNGALLRNVLDGFQGNLRAAGGLDPFGSGGVSPATSNTSLPTPLPRVDLESRPIVSGEKDPKLLNAMTRKLISAAENSDDLELHRLTRVAAAGQPVHEDDAQALDTLLGLLTSRTNVQAAAFFVLRVLLLDERSYSPRAMPLIRQLLEHLLRLTLQSSPSLPDGGFVSYTAFALGISVFVNALATPSGTRLLLLRQELDDLSHDAVVDAGLRALSHGKSEVRMMGSGLLYNITLALVDRCEGELPEQLVQVVCGALEAIPAESSPNVRIRLLKVVCLLIRKSESVATLAIELGYKDTLAGLRGRLGAEEDPVLLEILSALT